MTERGSERVRVDGCVCHGGKHLVFSSVYRVLCSTVTFYAERCQLNYCFVANWLCGYLPVVGCLWLFPRFRGLLRPGTAETKVSQAKSNFLHNQGQLVSWCLEPSQPLGSISGLLRPGTAETRVL